MLGSAPWRASCLHTVSTHKVDDDGVELALDEPLPTRRIVHGGRSAQA